MRYFGGLHAANFDSRVQVSVNGRVIDGFGLRKKPKAHSDYFLRIRKPSSRLRSPLAECETLYSWPLLPSHLDRSLTRQVVSVKIDGDARWDIDFVGIVVEPRETGHDVFLSHSSRDKAVVRQLAADLATRGVAVWVDEAELQIGDSLISKIGAAIESIEYLIVVLSPASVSSTWVQRELEIAMYQEIRGRRVKVLPVLIQECEIPPFIQGKVYADLTSDDRYDLGVQAICNKIQSGP